MQTTTAPPAKGRLRRETPGRRRRRAPPRRRSRARSRRSTSSSTAGQHRGEPPGCRGSTRRRRVLPGLRRRQGLPRPTRRALAGSADGVREAPGRPSTGRVSRRLPRTGAGGPVKASRRARESVSAAACSAPYRANWAPIPGRARGPATASAAVNSPSKPKCRAKLNKVSPRIPASPSSPKVSRPRALDETVRARSCRMRVPWSLIVARSPGRR